MCSIQFIPLTKSNLESASKLLSEHFFQREPISPLLGLTEDEINFFLDVVLQKAIKDELSVVALNEANEVVGCIISDDYFSNPPDDFSNITPKLNPVFLLLKKLGDEFRSIYPFEENKYYHLFMIATNEKGIATPLTDEAIKLALSKGYKYAVLEATGTISQHIAENSLNFKELTTIKYSEFEFKGDKIFESILDSDACKFYIKEIG
jgi:hypothetical protein